MAFWNKHAKRADSDAAEALSSPASESSEGEVSADEIMRKYDKESRTRIWEGVPKKIITAVMVVFSIYCLCMTLLSTEQAEARLARFLAFIIVIGYLMYPASKKHNRINYVPWYDIVLMALGFGAFMYYALNCTEILLMGARIEPLHVVLGIIGIATLVELCRRCVGIPIIVVAMCLVGYAFFWQFTSSPSADPLAAVRKIVQKPLLHHKRHYRHADQRVLYLYRALHHFRRVLGAHGHCQFLHFAG